MLSLFNSPKKNAESHKLCAHPKCHNCNMQPVTAQVLLIDPASLTGRNRRHGFSSCFMVRSSHTHCALRMVHEDPAVNLFILPWSMCRCFAWSCCHGSKCRFYYYLNQGKNRDPVVQIQLVAWAGWRGGGVCCCLLHSSSELWPYTALFVFIQCFLWCRTIPTGRSESGCPKMNRLQQNHAALYSYITRELQVKDKS